MPYSLNKIEFKLKKKIEEKYYMLPSIYKVNSYISKITDKKVATSEVFKEIYNILTNSQNEVEEMLDERVASGDIKDKKQALKTIAGSSFSNLLIYIFLLNKECGNIRSDIFITSEKSQVPNFDSISCINVGDETQKPDCDIVIYSLNKNNTLKKCVIVSLKTSLRERAGQTYKWKLLMEIATSDNIIKEKYNISYNPTVVPLVCFATVNFYNEINNPQHRGMFKFFDKSFIARDKEADFIDKLSELPNFVNEKL